jgi:hypothetical protein
LFPFVILLTIIGILGPPGIIRCVYVLSRNETPSVANTWQPILSNLGRLFGIGLISVLISFPIAIILFFGTGSIMRSIGLQAASAWQLICRPVGRREQYDIVDFGDYTFGEGIRR